MLELFLLFVKVSSGFGVSDNVDDIDLDLLSSGTTLGIGNWGGKLSNLIESNILRGMESSKLFKLSLEAKYEWSDSESFLSVGPIGDKSFNDLVFVEEGDNGSKPDAIDFEPWKEGVEDDDEEINDVLDNVELLRVLAWAICNIFAESLLGAILLKLSEFLLEDTELVLNEFLLGDELLKLVADVILALIEPLLDTGR